VIALSSFSGAILSLAASPPSWPICAARHCHQAPHPEDRQTVGGVPFHARRYVVSAAQSLLPCEVAFKGEVLPGEQLAILDRELFDAVQVKLSEQTNNHQTLRTSSNALLMDACSTTGVMA